MVKTIKVGPYELSRELGRGATGTVYEATDHLRGVTVAIKVLKHSQNSKKALLHEIKVMKDLGHENTVRFFTVFHDKTMSYLALEIVGGGELFDTVVKWKRETRERLTFHYFFQLMSGVKYLHRGGYAHRDLKLENLLLSKDGVLKIADFGVSKEIELNPMKTCCGSPDYIAPEILVEKNGYDGQLADIWSCGVILYTMICGEFPFETTQHIMQAKYKVPRWCPKLAKETCIDKILVVDPTKRLQTADAVLATEWCRSFSAGKNSFGLLRDLILRRLRGPRAKLRRVSLQILIMLKVIGAFSRASFKGAPRDIRVVTSDRLKSVLRIVNAHIRPAGTGAPQRTNSFKTGNESSFKGVMPNPPASSNPPRSPFGRKMRGMSPFGKKMGGWFGAGSQKSVLDDKEINWKGLRTNSEYLLQMKLLQEVERASVAGLSKDEMLAVFLNMYHLMVINGCASYGKHLGEMNDEERRNFFNDVTYIIAYCQLSLNDLLHGVMRSNGKLPGWKGLAGIFGSETQFDTNREQEKIDLMLPEIEPMTHFALSHLTTISPKILVYEPSTVRSQLVTMTREYLSEHLAIEVDQHAVRVPATFNAFQADFGSSKQDVLNWIHEHLNDTKKRELSSLMDKGFPTIIFHPLFYDFKWQPLPELEAWSSEASKRFDKPLNWRFEQVTESEIAINTEVRGSRKLEVKILSAFHLPKMDLIGSIDAFCVINFQDTEYKTSIKKGNFNPEWNESFLFTVSDVLQKPEPLRITLMDWDRVRPSEKVGEILISSERMWDIIRSPAGWEEDKTRHIIMAGKAVVGHDKQLSAVRIYIRANEVESTGSGSAPDKVVTPMQSRKSDKNALSSNGRKEEKIDSPADRRRRAAANDENSVSTPKSQSPLPVAHESGPSDSQLPADQPPSSPRRSRRRSSGDIKPLVDEGSRKSKSPEGRNRRRSSINIPDHRDWPDHGSNPAHLANQPKSRSSSEVLNKTVKEVDAFNSPVSEGQGKTKEIVKTDSLVSQSKLPIDVISIRQQAVEEPASGISPVKIEAAELFPSTESLPVVASRANGSRSPIAKSTGSTEPKITSERKKKQSAKLSSFEPQSPNQDASVVGSSCETPNMELPGSIQDSYTNNSTGEIPSEDSNVHSLSRLASASSPFSRLASDGKKRAPLSNAMNSFQLRRGSKDGKAGAESLTESDKNELAVFSESGHTEVVASNEKPPDHMPELPEENVEEIPTIEQTQTPESPIGSERKAAYWDHIEEIVQVMADGWKQPDLIEINTEPIEDLRNVTRRLSLRKLSMTAEQIAEGDARRKLIGSYDYNAPRDKQPEIKVRYSAKKKRNRSSCSIL